MKTLAITTDGACIGNPGPGGWACILRFSTFVREMFGSEPRSTNNRMELTAVIKALEELKEPCAVTLYTDSQYVRRGITEWLSQWKARGWRKLSGRKSEPVQNQDLWMELDRAIQPHRITWKWVKGHASHADNLRADLLAQRAAREQIFSRGTVRRIASEEQPVPAP